MRNLNEKMRNLRDDRGKKIFSKEEWLAPDPIDWYFSRLSVLYRTWTRVIRILPKIGGRLCC